MRLSSICVLRPVGTVLLTAGLMLLGAVAYKHLGIASLPSVEFPTIYVSAYLPGASAETMAATVAAPLERRLGLIDGVRQLTSSSVLSRVNIPIQFELSRDIESAARDVQAAINAAAPDLPPDLPQPPVYRKANPASLPTIVLALTSETLRPGAVYDLVEQILVPKLSEIEGVSDVTINGAEKSALRVQIDPRALAAMNLGMEDVRRALLRANAHSPTGVIDGEAQSYTVSIDDQLLTPETAMDVIVAYRNGAAVRIRDLGQAVDGSRNTRLMARFNQQRGVIVYVYRLPGANIVDVSDSVKAAVAQAEHWFPPSVSISVFADRTSTIRAAIADVKFTLALTTGLVVLSILLFLQRFWATVIPSIAIPASLCGTLAVMWLLGYTLDNISLLALTVAIGFVVDDAIVVIENVARYIEEGQRPVRAALKGAREISFTILSITVSLVAAFIPFLFMGGYVGRFLREFSVTLTAAILISGVVALTLTPSLCGRLLRDTRDRPLNRAQRLCGGGIDACLAGYAWALRHVLRFPLAMLALTLATVAGTVYLYIVLPKGFFPRQDINIVWGRTIAPDDVSFAAMDAIQKRVEEIILADPAVENLGSFLGNLIPSGFLYFTLKDRASGVTAEQVIARLKEKMSEIPNVLVFLNPVQDVAIGARQSASQYQYTLQSDDPVTLNRWTQATVLKFRTLKDSALRDIITDQRLRGLETYLNIDRDSASRLGIQPSEIDSNLYSAFGQRILNLIYTPLDQYELILEVSPEVEQDSTRLRDVYMPGGPAGRIPLSAVAKVEHRYSPLVINHQGAFPAATISFNVAPGMALSDAVAQIAQAEAELNYPQNLRGAFQGDVQAFRQHLETQSLLIMAAIIAVYIILGVLYESYVHPLTILSTLPSAGLGAFAIMYVTGTQLTIIAMIGLVLLIGIVKKNAIMMVDFALDAQRAGTPRDQAIYDACLKRFRPIMMTTMATILGALPIAFDYGIGSELRRPLGITLLGGLCVSQLLTMFSTPVIYLYMARLEDRLARRRAVRRQVRSVAGS